MVATWIANSPRRRRNGVKEKYEKNRLFNGIIYNGYGLRDYRLQ